ncbi:gfo/Idh/MocA family oxidoreductase [Agathobaculum butyriciproducens]|nr:gfo/Idh/MocA family oxidoreductase [Agathobaculum butyriciproducens]
MTASDTHYEIAKCFLEHGIHVICDKPLALRTEEAEELARIAEECGLLFCITYSYTGYALIRQAREMIRAGAIGNILHVRVQHPEDWVISSAVDGKVDTSAWRFQPEKVGSSLCANDLGTHAEQMVTQVTGLHVKRVLAMMDTYPRDLPLDTDVNVLMDFGGGVTGTLWASQIAIGHECDSGIYVIGTEGSLK